MGFIDTIKNRYFTSGNKVNEEQLNGYLKSSKDNLKLANENLGKFLEAMREFKPARRHEALYYEQVKDVLVHMKGMMRHGLIFLDERMNNNINTMNTVKNPDQLKEMIGTWVKSIQANDDKVYDILKILQVEMWGEDKIRKGFPFPHNRDQICNYLVNAVSYMNSTKNYLDSYISYSSMYKESS